MSFVELAAIVILYIYPGVAMVHEICLYVILYLYPGVAMIHELC